MPKAYNRQHLDSYMDSLLFATNASDIEYFETKVKEMLDEKASDVLGKLNTEELETYEDLKTKLVSSSFNNELMQYEKAIDKLLDAAAKRVS